MVPRGCQNFIIKGGVGYEDEAERFLEKKNYQWSFGKKKGKTKGKVNITFRYPVKATIAHTRIQKESNFASFEGWNSYLRL